ncbi:MAG: hypothetical protein S4CHLAM20_09330 [Chlamydiia bacterium]|nr:hypothetical protein [Chlamydiia bacterium]
MIYAASSVHYLSSLKEQSHPKSSTSKIQTANQSDPHSKINQVAQRGIKVIAVTLPKSTVDSDDEALDAFFAEQEQKEQENSKRTPPRNIYPFYIKFERGASPNFDGNSSTASPTSPPIPTSPLSPFVDLRDMEN